MARRIRKIVVIGVGTSPPLPLRPLADEVLRVWESEAAGPGAAQRGTREAGSCLSDGPGTTAVSWRLKLPWALSTAWIQVRSGPPEPTAY